ncbi:abortive infection protein [Novosphingobium fuchskuhlense]|uniref:Abortive infection protein n=1 Tax=Novosphingobium fuchskuhlense TaxID=1117702 RepID=A0A124JVX0_9SPHN|nr:CPBP family glutamic-type intramembrane protease [Novosphingobium fuchskuhlense]KUR72725.1 abortive infection protein [Novosphingobium fuchskuhlense]
MDAIFGISGVISLLLVFGFAIGLSDRERCSLGWLVLAALLVLLNDALLTSGYGLIPDLIGGSWNWQGKVGALFVTLLIAGLPIFGWAECGFKLAQKPGSLSAAMPVVAAYCAFFLGIALLFPNEPARAEDIAFQISMPGLEEELFYRGLLLAALDRAFAGRWRFVGVDWSWGAILTCALFGLAHAFGFSDGSFTFDPLTMALTAIPALLAVWLRQRTGSLVLPVALHNFGNTLPMLL